MTGLQVLKLPRAACFSSNYECVCGSARRAVTSSKKLTKAFTCDAMSSSFFTEGMLVRLVKGGFKN